MFIRPLWGGAAGGGYDPFMNIYDGTTGYFENTDSIAPLTAGTLVARFNTSSFTGGDRNVMAVESVSGSIRGFHMRVTGSDHATVNDRSRVYIEVGEGTGPTVIARIYSETQVCDGADHVIHFEMNCATGIAALTVDGVLEDQTGGGRVAPTSGTMSTGGTRFNVGSEYFPTATKLFGGSIGYVGFHNTANTDAADFMTGNLPNILDETTWSEWVTRPILWNALGDMDSNAGTAPNLVRTGGVVTET